MSEEIPTDSTGALIRWYRRFEVAPAPSEIVEVHRLADDEIAVGVEAVTEFGTVVVEVALDLELLPERQVIAEFGAVGDRPGRTAR